MPGSPDCNIDRTFIYQFYFPTAVNKFPTPNKTYRNPIYLAKEYKEMIDLGEAKNQAELARKLDISRARVTQILNILKIDKNVILKIEQMGDPITEQCISERTFRKNIKYFLKTYLNNTK